MLRSVMSHELAMSACGYRTDCPPSYSAADIIRSAAEWNLSNITATAALAARRASAAADCSSHGTKVRTSVLATGGWCLSEPIPKNHGRSRSGGTVFWGPNETHILPAGHYPADRNVVFVLAALLSNRIPSLAIDRPQSINDFGAGVGQYGHALRSIDPNVAWSGFDGAGNVESYTKGFVRFFDLTLPLNLPRADWVLSLEVGEHLPSSMEAMYLRNLHAHQCRGIIGSWAALGQAGTGHINNHRREYVVRRFEELGYERHEELERLLRTNVQRLNDGCNATCQLPTYKQLHDNCFAMVRKIPIC